jgi:RNA 3'-phosphate cyclase
MADSMDLIHIDGSIGEGGGQVLRTSLALALITGKAFRISKIRQCRSKPGLMAQHLKAVEAAQLVGAARVEGAHRGSQSLLFEPSGIHPGNFQLNIGTAGSTSLVLQTILVPLSFSTTGSVVSVKGGTHVPWSPCFHYLQLHWLHYMRRIGFNFQLELYTAGFYPRGGGHVCATVLPASPIAPLNIVRRGPLRRIRGISAVANLNVQIAERQKARVLRRLRGTSDSIHIEIEQLHSPSTGSMLLLLAELENSQACFSSLGARGKSAEQVADETVDELLEFVATDGAIDHYLADQLILPLALAKGVSEVRTSRVTQHLLTNVEVVKNFIPVTIKVCGGSGGPGLISVRGCRSDSAAVTNGESADSG